MGAKKGGEKVAGRMNEVGEGAKMGENSRKREGREGEKARKREGEGEKKLTWV